MQSVQVVKHVDVMAFEKQHFGLRKTAAWTAAIDIAANRRNRRDIAERFQNRGIAHVAEMQDLFDTGESRNDLGPQQAVRIADDAYFHLPKLNRSDQRLFDFALRISGAITGSITWRSAPGLCGSWIARL